MCYISIDNNIHTHTHPAIFGSGSSEPCHIRLLCGQTTKYKEKAMNVSVFVSMKLTG